jgi:pyrroline-5-carboxylate reductase
MSDPAAPPLAIIGCGRITRALVRGLVASGHPPEFIRGTSRTGAGARALADNFGTLVAGSAHQAVRGAELVVLAVHPHETAAALEMLAECLEHGQILVTLVASWRTDAIAAAVPDVSVVRAVPNVAIAVRAGMTVISPGQNADDRATDPVESMFARLGEVLTVKEEQLETVSALSGAGPAMVSYFAQALAAAAAAQGLPAETASTLAVHAVYGTGVLLTSAGNTPASVIESVASPGGMTAAALHTLGQCQVPEAVRRAVAAAVSLSFGRQPPVCVDGR